MLIHCGLIVAIYSSAKVIVSKTTDRHPLDYGAVLYLMRPANHLSVCQNSLTCIDATAENKDRSATDPMDVRCCK